MTARLAGGALLGGVFLLLLPEPKPLDVVLGVLVAAGAMTAVGPSPLGRGDEHRGSLLALPRLVAWVVADIARGTARVAGAVVGVRAPRSPRTVAIDVGPCSEQALVLTGVLLTISPGSVLVATDADAQRLDVHVVDGHDPERISAQIRELHRLVVRVVGG